MLRGVRTTGGPVKDLRLGLGLLFLALLLTFYQQFQWQKSKWCNWICLQQKSYFAEKLEVCSMLSYVACRLMLAASVYCKPLMHPRLTFVPNAACHLDIMCFLALFDICRWGGGGVISSQNWLFFYRKTLSLSFIAVTKIDILSHSMMLEEPGSDQDCTQRQRQTEASLITRTNHDFDHWDKEFRLRRGQERHEAAKESHIICFCEAGSYNSCTLNSEACYYYNVVINSTLLVLQHN